MRVLLDDKKELDIQLEELELIYGIEGIFLTGDYKKAYIPLIEKEIPVYRGKENRFFIPAHNKEDWKYAKENEIDINQVIAPYFKGVGDEKLRQNIVTERRHSVIAIIKHNIGDKYLCVDCKNRNCKSFVLGGIEKGETPKEAAIREVKEETGYTDISISYISPIKLINHFYAGYKGVNRYATLDIVFGQLNTELNIGISESENKKHTVKWIDKKELENFININNNKYALNILLNGDTAFTGEGILINSKELDGYSSQEARKIVKERIEKR